MWSLSQIWTFCKSLWFIWTLPKETLQNYLDSYSLYDDEQKVSLQDRPKKLVHYYQVMNHLCALGQLEKMYIPPFMSHTSKNIFENQIEFERKMMLDLELTSKSLVLDVGCGRGLVALHVSRATGASVSGLNIDPKQLEQALMNNYPRGSWQQHDYNQFPLPYESNTFDAIYQIQAFSMSQDLPGLFKELHRILKPGGKIACLDWIKLPAYDPKKTEHRKLMTKIKPLIGAIETWSEQEYLQAMQPHFEITFSGNLSLDGCQAPLIVQADRYFTRLKSWVFKGIRWRVLPAHLGTLLSRFVDGGEAFVQADEMRLVTTSFYVVARKKKKENVIGEGY